MDNREKDSPARTIDSHGSTNASMETIVDRRSINSHQQQQQNIIDNQTATMENTTNTTNQNYNNKNSLTNSQISMISNDPKDPQHHIYTSPDLVLNSTTTSIIDKQNAMKKFKKDLIPIQPIGEQEMKTKLELLKAKGKSLDLISTKSSTRTKSSSSSSSLPPKQQQQSIRKIRKSFPIYIVLGIIQLVLSITLVALGSLLIIRDAALATTGSGIWSGGVAAIAGALGVINIGRSKNGFLAVSLICVATSTLGMALTGTGLVRDVNRLDQQEFNLMNTEAAVSAGCGLIFALALHLIVSIISVYQSAIKLCSRENYENSQMLENVITVNNSSMLNQQKVEEYFNSMSASDKEKILSAENMDKLMAMWMYSSKRGRSEQKQHQQQQLPVKKVIQSRPIMLVPATAGNGLPPQMLPPGCRHPSGIVLPSGILPTPIQFPPPPFPMPLLPPPPPPGTYRPIPISSRPASDISRRQRPPKRRTGRNDASRRQRRKSDSDAENRIAFTYTGLDRTIANRFLERQEQSNASHVDYSSSNDSFREGCPDVAM